MTTSSDQEVWNLVVIEIIHTVDTLIGFFSGGRWVASPIDLSGIDLSRWLQWKCILPDVWLQLCIPLNADFPLIADWRNWDEQEHIAGLSAQSWVSTFGPLSVKVIFGLQRCLPLLPCVGSENSKNRILNGGGMVNIVHELHGSINRGGGDH